MPAVPEVTPPFAHTYALIDAARTLVAAGDAHVAYPWASVSKVVSALAILVAVDRGCTTLDAPAGPPGATLTHLLSHASGLPLDSREPQLPPGKRRIYSNAGIEMAADHVAAVTGTPFDRWVEESVLEPLGMTDTFMPGSPAHSVRGPLVDLQTLARELLTPTLLSAELAQQIRTPVFADLAGIVPGYGRFTPCPWGLGVEVRGDKGDGGGHWTAPSASPRTFGHFGQSGSFVWVDPDLGQAGVFLGAEPFGPWHKAHWATFNQQLAY